MADLIDRQALLAKQYNASNFTDPTLAEMVVDVRDIEDAPTIDAVPVVRCKDCKYMEKYAAHPARFCKVWRSYNGMGDDGYCNYGERKCDNAVD